MKELDDTWEPETYKSGVIFLASLHFGPDEVKIIELTGYSPEEVKLRGDRLRESKIWSGDHIFLDSYPEDVPGAGATCLLLCILCAEGVVRRLDPEKAPGSKSATTDARTE